MHCNRLLIEGCSAVFSLTVAFKRSEKQCRYRECMILWNTSEKLVYLTNCFDLLYIFSPVLVFFFFLTSYFISLGLTNITTEVLSDIWRSLDRIPVVATRWRHFSLIKIIKLVCSSVLEVKDCPLVFTPLCSIRCFVCDLHFSIHSGPVHLGGPVVRVQMSGQ